MADRYAATGQQAAVEASPGETILSLFSPVTTHRAEMIYFSLGASGVQADQTQIGQLQRTTVQGTEGAGVVPTAFDPAAPAALMDAGENHSVEPTFTAATELWEEPVHIRNTIQIQLQPDGHFIIPAVVAAGITMRSFSSNYVGAANNTMHYLE